MTLDFHLKPTGWLYLFPFLFSAPGGLIGYACVKGEDSGMASSLLLFGILWSFVFGFAGWEIISYILF